MAQEIRDDNPFYKNWHELITPDRLEVTRDSHTEKYGKFICQPFERGFAATIGNSLRRIFPTLLLGKSSINSI